ncbi:Unannotated [Lentimonas sp. CC4]|nr:Unannotated [Lentimonas sp. CC4]CAA6687240.1 Unannotated [Lentimonas sp. CC6]CAA7074359.1 Unannotated [Lentimonas sp. CC4]CAA7171456.1 Unannotated [Lentimonas sp. CC21]CAA7180048.1 Unannotated [Lentimonas sp. CC8]
MGRGLKWIQNERQRSYLLRVTFLDAEKPIGAWNTMRVIVRGYSVVVTINDQLMKIIVPHLFDFV